MSKPRTSQARALRFLLYDGRAKGEDSPEDSVILDTADTESEARYQGRTTWDRHDAIWWEYDHDSSGDLVNGRPRWDLPPGGRR